ncbi:hypothetical protein DK853_49535, partial [Klebsiella oxytoca]
MGISFIGSAMGREFSEAIHIGRRFVMPKVHEPPKEPGEKRNFITEKIVRPSWTKRRLAQCG